MTDIARLQELLRAATVRLEVEWGTKVSRGTGFLVAPGIVATCAHVLGAQGAPLPARVRGRFAARRQDVELEPLPSTVSYDRTAGTDLAFLRVDAAADWEYAVVAGPVQTGDPLWAVGHPTGRFDAEPTLLTYQGSALLDGPAENREPGRVAGPALLPGNSGAPVLNLRTGAVCGMAWLSNKIDSAHLVPAADLLTGLAKAVGEPDPQQPGARTMSWLSALDDEAVHALGWRYPGPALRAYLEVAARAARDETYISALGDSGADAPPLGQVYVKQRARARLSAAEDGVESGLDLSRGEVPADELLHRDESLVLVGGAGAGKTSLLRIGTLRAAEAWLQAPETAPPTVPVRILAADIAAAATLPEAIAEGVFKALKSHHHSENWPLAMFSREPMRGLRWMVLVDGLDEVTDTAGRRAVAAKLAAEAGSDRTPYRFVLTTREIPGERLPSGPGWAPHAYELQPLSADEGRELAEAWFTALGTPDPAAAANAFRDELARAGLLDLAEVPLMTAILCRVSRDTGGQLPDGRTAAFAEFVEVIGRRPYDKSAGGLGGQLPAALEQFGPAGEYAGGQLLDKSWDLIAQLADARLTGAAQAAGELVGDWTEDLRPGNVPAKEWRWIIQELLKRSGLMTGRGSDVVFIHQTVAEFLAARRFAKLRRKHAADAMALQALVMDPEPPKRGEPDRLSARYSASFLRFLLGLWPDAAETREVLTAVAVRCGPEGGLLIADLVHDRTTVAPEVLEAAHRTLAEYGARQIRSDEPLPGRLKAALSATRGARFLRGRTERMSDEERAEAAEQREEQRVRSSRQRAESIRALFQLGDPRAQGLFDAFVADPAVPVTGLFETVLLFQRDEPRGWELMAALAARPLPDPSPDDPTDSYSRNAMSSIGIRVYREAMLQCHAAADLARRGDPRGNAALRSLAAARPVHVWLAPWPGIAARVLHDLGDPLGIAQLRDIADDAPSLEARRSAAEILTELGDPGGVERLAWYMEHSGGDFERMRVAQVLARAGYEPATAKLRFYVAFFRAALERFTEDESELSSRTMVGHTSWVAAGAAATLADLGDPLGRETLIQIARLPAAGGQSRSAAVGVLAERKDPLAADLLVEQVEYGTVPFDNLPAGLREIQAKSEARSDGQMRDKALALLHQLGDRRAEAYEPTSAEPSSPFWL